MIQWIRQNIRQRLIKSKTNIIENPDLIIEMATKLKEEKEEKLIAQRKVEKLEQTIITNKPYTNFGKSIYTANGGITIGQFAKILNNDNMEIGRNRLYKILRDDGYLINNGKDKNMPKQQYVEQGLFKVDEKVTYKTANRERISTTTLITGKGQIHLIDQIQNRG